MSTVPAGKLVKDSLGGLHTHLFAFVLALYEFTLLFDYLLKISVNLATYYIFYSIQRSLHLLSYPALSRLFFLEFSLLISSYVNLDFSFRILVLRCSPNLSANLERARIQISLWSSYMVMERRATISSTLDRSWFTPTHFKTAMYSPSHLSSLRFPLLFIILTKGIILVA